MRNFKLEGKTQISCVPVLRAANVAHEYSEIKDTQTRLPPPAIPKGENVLRLGKLCPLANISVRNFKNQSAAEPPSFRFSPLGSGGCRGPMEIGLIRCQRVTMSLCFLQLGNLIPRYSTYSSPQHSFLKTPYSVLIEPANKSTIALVPRKSLRLPGVLHDECQCGVSWAFSSRRAPRSLPWNPESGAGANPDRNCV